MESVAAAIDKQTGQSGFSGVITISIDGKHAFGRAYGLANRSDSISNAVSTRFALASGSKLFTAIAVCRLVQDGKLTYETRLKDCLDIRFEHFHPDVTVYHLLTHTSGIPDYWDERTQDYEQLWRDRPAYSITSPSDFLPMFQHLRMLTAPGETFRYNDAGFNVLGLIIEKVSGARFQDFVHQSVLEPAGMDRSGYFSIDQLPPDTASGYIEDDEDNWRTNIFAVPRIGTPDGGAYATASDLDLFWSSLLGNRLLSEKTTQALLTPQFKAEDEGDDVHYGLGVWIRVSDGEPSSCYITGWDPGVNMLSEIFLEQKVTMTILGNTNRPILPIREAIIGTLPQLN
ncbi:MAG: serine hydrolase [Candidatus Zixiibacteriota bacterium]|nr:MAG: serine hydrolase [candidate division Zixibacteria bacterium]